MKHTSTAPLSSAMLLQHTGVLAFAAVLLSACTTQQAYEGLKAGRKANCLEYPESEFSDCMGETKTSYEEYRRQREEVTGN